MEKFRVDSAFCVNSGVAASFDAGEIGLFEVEGEASVCGGFGRLSGGGGFGAD